VQGNVLQDARLEDLAELIACKVAEKLRPNELPAPRIELREKDLKTLANRISKELVKRISPETSRFLTVASAANYCSLSEDSIRGMLLAGKVVALRPVNGRVLIDKRLLEAAVLSSTKRARRHRGGYSRDKAEDLNGERQDEC
jgi:hypothetical protein